MKKRMPLSVSLAARPPHRKVARLRLLVCHSAEATGGLGGGAVQRVLSRIAQESRLARIFLDFSAFPRLEVRQEGDIRVIVWRDLRFADRRADGFLCEVRIDASGRILSERIVF